MKPTKTLLSIGLTFLGFSAMAQQNTVFSIIENSPDHETLETALEASKLDATLSDTQSDFTVFAPTDAAFDALDSTTLATLLADPEGDLADILTYHVVGGDTRAAGLSNGLQVVTVNGKNVTFQVGNNEAYINNVKISKTDLVADNGVVHVIDAVIMPSTATVVDVIVNSENHNTLETAVIAAKLDGTLSGSGEFTVFAPTDAAFDAIDSTTLATLLADPEGDLADILTYHVVGGDTRAAGLSNGLQVAAVNGKNVTFQVGNNEAYINNVKISKTDIVAGNGVVHVIDAVIMPSTATVVDVIVNSENHNTLETAVIAAKLDGTLSGSGEFTVFAPTDAAFDAIDSTTLATLLADPEGDLAEILKYHVISGDVRANQITEGLEVATVNTEKVKFSLVGGPKINDANITVTDIIAGNGVVHVIDAVILPPSITALFNNTTVEVFATYPNPASDIVTLNNVDLNTEELNIYTSTGNEVTNYNVITNNTINVSNLENGIYYIKVNAGEIQKLSKLYVK